MTREEAIKIIKNYDVNGCGYCHQGGDEVEVAFNMAIEALEQEPCDDAISRQALLNNLEKPMNWTDSEAEVQEQRDYESFVSLIESMPPVTPQQKIGKWIDVAGGCECSECGCSEPGYSNFCPDCGAKMEVEE